MSRPNSKHQKGEKHKNHQHAESLSLDSSSSSSSTTAQLTNPSSFEDTTTGIQYASLSSRYTTLDCRLLEGGGQTLRISLALSALFSLPVRLTHIRANRPKGGGLAAQHTCGVILVAQISRSNVKGATIGSKELTFDPPPIDMNDELSTEEKSYMGDVKTAGSTLLLLQISLPVLIFLSHPSTVTLRGGTHATLAPPFDFLTSVFLPILQKHTGIKVTVQLIRYGFFPRGGGEVAVTVQPISTTLSPIILTKRGTITHLTGVVVVAGRYNNSHANLIANAAKSTLKSNPAYKNLSLDIDISVVEGSNMDPALFLLLLAHTSTDCIISNSIIGERGDTPQSVGINCMTTLLSSLSMGGCVDEYMQDQLLIYAGLASGKSLLKVGELSLHTRTAIHWIQCLTGAKISLRDIHDSEKEDSDTLITRILEIEGVGYRRGMKSRNNNLDEKL